MELISRWAWVLGLVGLAALGASTVVAYVTGTWDGNATNWAIAGAVALVGYAVLDRERVGDTLSTRAFIYGSGSWLMVLLFGLIVGASYKLSTDHDKTWDLTTDGTHTLSDHTVGVVEGLSEPVEVLAFYRNGAPSREAFADLIGRFQEHSSALTVTYYDPLSQPRLAEENNITSDHGTVILRTADDREKRIEGDITEQKLSSKLVLLVSRQEHRICWALGHGEPDPDDEFSADGLGQLVLALEELNYQVTKSLVVTQGIDADCEVLVIARPSVDWLPIEHESLAGYVAGGGAVVALLDPFETDALAEELERYGIQVGADIVIDVDPDNMMMGVEDPSMVVLSGNSFMPHPVTSSLGAAVVLPGARSIGALEGVSGIELKTILESGPAAWGETQPDGEEIGPSEEETVGEVPLMVIAEVTDPSVLDAGDAVAEAPGGRLVVIGDSDFVANSHMNWGNNRDLFLNTIAWLVSEEDQIGERPSDGDMLEITAAGEAIMCLISIVFVPGAAVLFGGLTWFRRRWL
jgi:ABC-type uncharacterized transport system involved in gliding motility auxiliary subunit